ncbi:MAG: sigma-70 family RNA polymerase sigma factor [Rhodothermia bacterium]|nr:sigma-70 family RNA polymerase sigma factor [Rhodothermia bacterium]
MDLNALLSGDKAAFEQLVRQESPRLFRVIVRIVGDDDEARSVMQETFLQAYQRLDTFRGESKLTTWLYAIGINLSRAALRKARRYNTLEEQDIDRLQPSFNRGMFADESRDWSPLDRVQKSELQRVVREAIDRLPDDYRIVVTLRDIRELSTTEVAQMLDISEGAVRVRLHRARRALKKLIDPHII